MRIQIAVPDEHVTPDVVDPVLEAVTRLNDHMLQTGQTPTSHELIKGGAVWRPENMGDEHFDHGGTIASRGWGDCDDWAPLHAATLRASGEDPGAVARVIPSGPNTFHAIVQRSNGSIEDPSVAAGMKSDRPSNISGAGDMSVWACDPHDGRIYTGALAPAVGPLSLHCGPGLAVRGCHVHGCGPLYEARVDLPIMGSRMSPVRHRHHSHHHRRRGHRVHGMGVLPYAIAVTHQATSKQAALHGAIVGALLCGDASEMVSPVDRYKLLALHSAMSGMSPGQVHDMLVAQLHADMMAASHASGRHPEEHSKELLAMVHPGAVHGTLIVGGFFSDLGHIASGIVSDIGHAASAVAHTVGPWVGDIIHGVEAAASVVPGLGTAVSDIVATAESAYDTIAATLSGNPLEGAIKTAYNYALATVPGAASLHPVLDPVVDALINLTVKHEPVESAILDAILTKVPDAPKLGPISPRSVAASLAHLIVGHLGVKNTGTAAAPKSTPMTAAQAAAVAAGLKAHPGNPMMALASAVTSSVRAPPIKTPPKAAPKPPPAPTKVVPMVVHPAAAAHAPHLPALTMRKPTVVPLATASKPLGAAHAATHKVTMADVNPMVQHV